MSEIDDYKERYAKIAKRFLLTAVIVDDEAQIQNSPKPTASLKKPERHTLDPMSEETSTTNEASVHSLDARTLVDAFAKHGLICAVIAPPEDDSLAAATVVPATRRADMVILDWQLYQDKGEKALELLKKLLKSDEVGRLRLIAIYTGENDICAIGDRLQQELQQQGWNFQSNKLGVELSYEHCRIVIYAKSGTSLPSDLEDRAISEDDVAKRLIGDFADMTKGLLPSIALTSLTAVRENAHKVLDSFSSDLDPAFLAHRVCLPSPDDSQQHMVSLLENELQAIMNDATMEMNPASLEAVKDWLYSKFSQDTKFLFGEKELSFQDVARLLDEGLNQSPLGRQDYKFLSSGFVENENGSEDLDRQLAWMFNFRTVRNSPPPILQLGTALRRQDQESGSDLFLCMRPRCDSLRLQDEETFLLLPLIDPEKDTIQLVLKIDKNEYLRRSVCTNPSQWLLEEFAPNDSKKCVVAEQGPDEQFFFICTKGTKFKWIGELKADFAQRVAQHFASGLSPVAIDNSEWLRRRERSGQ